MNYFERFSSNTIAGSGNQFFFRMDEHETRTGRLFYKITHGGTYRYSLLFSNVIDSTYADGSVSRKNLPCESWQIHNARIGRCRSDIFATDATQHRDNDVSEWKSMTFDGCLQKTVACGEVFWCDPIEMTFASGEYLCLELTFSGTMIPYHEESLLPVFVKKECGWEYDKRMPFAGMIGCDRSIKHKIAFWGDSITQGIGTPNNSYAHWNALVANMLGDEFACWNLGIGYARASDAASLGAWWEKAKQNDTVVLCLGANDILQNQPEEQIKQDIETVVKALKSNGTRVILQTVPPFEYTSEQLEVWKRVNEYICKAISKDIDFLFDVVPFLSSGEPNHAPEYGGHPNEEGCKIWADALYNALKDLF